MNELDKAGRRLPLPGFDPAFASDHVLSPALKYTQRSLILDYPSVDGTRWVRVAFDRCDSHRVSRGEHPPYPFHAVEEQYSPFCVVRPSSWLKERYSYEREHYGPSYNAEEMHAEFEHYLFSFHDEFVEVLAAGVHFEFQSTPVSSGDLSELPSWQRLPNEASAKQIGDSQFPLLLRCSRQDRASILQNSVLAEQIYLQVDLDLDVLPRQPFLRVAVRTRDGETTSRLRHSGGKVSAEFAGFPSDQELREAINEEIETVRQRRRDMQSRRRSK